MYLWCLAGDTPREWLRWLPWAEFLFNTAYQTSLRDTPFRVVYGRDPPSIRSYEPGETRVPAVAKSMEEGRISLRTSATVWSRHRRTRSATTTVCTAMSLIRSVIGRCFDYVSARCRLFLRRWAAN
jgi:hypothetical protein